MSAAKKAEALDISKAAGEALDNVAQAVDDIMSAWASNDRRGNLECAEGLLDALSALRFARFEVEKIKAAAGTVTP